MIRRLRIALAHLIAPKGYIAATATNSDQRLGVHRYWKVVDGKVVETTVRVSAEAHGPIWEAVKE